MKNPFSFSRVLQKSLRRKTVLFVCTGNTCRSPMAAALYRNSLSWWQRLWTRVESAGISAGNSSGASTNAVMAMLTYGIDIRQHRSRKLTKEILANADVIYGMTSSHVDTISLMAPNANVHLLSPTGIPDPYGGTPEKYLNCAVGIKKAIEMRRIVGILSPQIYIETELR